MFEWLLDTKNLALPNWLFLKLGHRKSSEINKLYIRNMYLYEGGQKANFEKWGRSVNETKCLVQNVYEGNVV